MAAIAFIGSTTEQYEKIGQGLWTCNIPEQNCINPHLDFTVHSNELCLPWYFLSHFIPFLFCCFVTFFCFGIGLFYPSALVVKQFEVFHWLDAAFCGQHFLSKIRDSQVTEICLIKLSVLLVVSLDQTLHLTYLLSHEMYPR